MSETNIDKFKRLLSELFMFDYADLDFGIYRIMNAKRDEIRHFLDDDLLPQVRQEIDHLDTDQRERLIQERDDILQQLRDLQVPDPDNNPKIQAIDEKLAQSIDVTALENDIFSDLYDFFRRYYSEGDYLSLRRYKKGVYAIPYEGEEVKLHWANADQYYIKTSEYFRDYTFKLRDHRRVHFKLTSADTEQNNNKANNEKRVFVLCEEDFIAEEDGELVIRFEYLVDPEKRNQSDLNREAVERILSASNLQHWMLALGKPAPTEANPDRTLLHKYLMDYTSRNTFDYFIHKDLGTFLRRELDFFIKNEIMHLDDIEHASALRVESYLAKIKALRRVAKKVIDFLEQLENFQKKLWLKKKFVIETHYCVTLDRVPEELYAEIAANDAQREEWVRLFAIDEINGDLIEKRYSVPLNVEFLQQNQYLLIDTRFFDDNFKYRLLSSFGDLDTAVDGTLINSENFQALGFLDQKYRESIECIYIDPPYNTDASAILYKNDYKNSSWLTLISNRIERASVLSSSDTVLCMAIDDEEVAVAKMLLDRSLAKRIGVAIVRSNPQSRKAKGTFSPVHEYALFYGHSDDSTPGNLEITEKRRERYPNVDEQGNYAWLNFIRTGTNDLRSDRPKLFYPIYVDDRDTIRIPSMTWNHSKGEYDVHESPKESETVVYPVVENNGSATEKRWHRGYQRILSKPSDYRVRRSKSGQISIDFKTRLDEVSTPSTWWDKREYASANYGAAQLKDLFGKKPFDFPKAVKLVEDCVRAANGNTSNCIVLDYFAGSGTTGHAVINLNREDDEDRKFILVEMGQYFDTVLKPRILKAIYSSKWDEGKPVSRDGISFMFKYFSLESYEDTLNNLRWNRTPQQQKLLWDESKDEFREDYMLHYMLDVEAKGSASLLDLKQFVNPFAYQLEIGTGTVGETRLMTIDLVETFNYLLGLHVRRVQAFDHIRTVEGENRDGQHVLVIWRNQEEIDNEALDAFFLEMGGLDAEFDLIYVNGDNHLENLKQGKETWQVRLIEPTFHQLMFDVQDV